MHRIRALIFDFDGLILDTESPFQQSWQEVFWENGFSLPLSEWAALVGHQIDSPMPYELLEERLGQPVDREAIRERRQRRELELVSRESVLPGVEEYIRRGKQLGMKLGVASSSHREWVVGHLERLGLLREFDCVRCAEDVSHTKPDPELYQSVLTELGVRGEEGLAFEDSLNGVLAAKGAGMFCVAVPNRVTRHLSLEPADLCLASLEELPLEQLLARAGGGPAAAYSPGGGVGRAT
jgi:HAD superfamily hydrolase (TIGR01509 family)